MGLQDKFEGIVSTYAFPEFKTFNEIAKECTKLSLQEQIKLVKYIAASRHKTLLDIINELRNQLKELDYGTKNSK